MFNFDGKLTDVSTIATSLLENAELFDQKDPEDRLTCVVYRKDPIDHYLFVTALVGVEQREPMYGPVVADDRRLPRGQSKDNDLGFAKREGTEWAEPFRDNYDLWEIWLSGYPETTKHKKVEEFKDKHLPALSTLLNSYGARNEPIFPQLWYKERLLRGRLLDQFQRLPSGARLEAVTERMTTCLEDFLNESCKANAHLGIYLDTGADWALVRRESVGNQLPRSIKTGYRLAKEPNALDEAKREQLNAFAWVYRSTRPVLLRPEKLSSVWDQRLENCGPDYTNTDGDVCIVPLPDLNHPERSIGLIVMTSRDPDRRLLPAHLFLLSRLARDLSSHISPLLPVPGFPWWPSERQARTETAVEWKDSPATQHRKREEIERIVREIMPNGSEIHIRTLASGHSGAEVFQLDVKDQNGHLEIPRVLKIGTPDKISNELQAYYRFVHNKRLGVAARVEVARLIRESSDKSACGSIIYTLVGSGEKVLPWSEWGKTASPEAIQNGLKMLGRQLSGWYLKKDISFCTDVDLLIKKPLFQGGEFIIQQWCQGLETPSIKQVEVLIRDLLTKSSPLLQNSGISTSVVHGDLHSGNVFSSLREGRDAVETTPWSVAIIDWGSVVDRRHPLEDISRLLVDLKYKVKWKPDNNDDAKFERTEKEMKAWADEFEASSRGWRLALIRQIAQMLFWCGATEKEPYLSAAARQQAWSDLQGLKKDYLTGLANGPE